MPPESNCTYIKYKRSKLAAGFKVALALGSTTLDMLA